MGKLNIFLVLIFLASVYAQCTKETARIFYKRAIYDFTVKLAERINQNTEGHFIASGLSLWHVLSALSLGASNETLAEFTRVLRMQHHICFQRRINEYARLQYARTKTFATIIERSAAILVDINFNVTSYFEKSIDESGLFNLETLDFYDPESAAAYVNDLVRNTTHNAINEIVTSNDIEGPSIIVTDALHFIGVWHIMFSQKHTNISDFYDDKKNNRIGIVNLMSVCDVFNLTNVEQLQAQVLELPYGGRTRLSMLILLPFSDKTISNVIYNLRLISLKTIFARFGNFSAKKVLVQLPMFKMSSDFNMKEFLMDMGLRSMFDRSEAKFNNLSTDPGLFVSNVIQKAEIDVHEQGHVVSAAIRNRVRDFHTWKYPKLFVANKPFVFMIVDKSMEIPIFIGAYSAPYSIMSASIKNNH